MTGPSFTDSTSIAAPKRPVSTLPGARPRSASTKCSYRGMACSGRAGPDEGRASSLRDVSVERELTDDEDVAADVLE